MILTCPTADAVQEIEKKLEARIGPRRFQLWFKNSSRLQLDGGQLRVQVPNNFIGGWIENNFSTQLKEIASETLNHDTVISYQINPQLAQSESGEEQPSSPTKTSRSSLKPRLNRKLRNSLDTFIVGPSNELAVNAIHSVVETVISPYNPLFIHGGCGLGKTHLVQGLCNALSEKHTQVGWQYVSGEEFTNQFIMAMKTGSLDAFRRQYRNVDVLVIDDVHFLANKRATQEEFLHTFNTINAAGKQVVMASDAHPKSIGQFHNSLVDRFISGMVVQVNTPDQTTRAKIIEARAIHLGHHLPPAVVRLIAEKITGNVRELEGAILKLIAYASLCNRPVGIDIAEKVIREYGHTDRSEIRISVIESKVADYFNVAVSDIRCSKRTRPVALARAVAMYIARKHTTLSFPEIGKYMGNKNHSTVVLACQKIEKNLEQNIEIAWEGKGKIRNGKIGDIIADIEEQLKHA